MKTILVHHNNNKFFKNISICGLDASVTIRDTTNSLYAMHYSSPFDIFMVAESSLISGETKQYLREFCSEKLMMVYRDSFSSKDSKTKRINDNRFILDQSDIEDLKREGVIFLVLPENAYNSEIYSDINLSNLQNKKPQIACFMDHIDKCPLDLERYLYPLDKKPIKIFNNPSLRSSNNLGLLDEYDKLKILLESEYYLSIDRSYDIEASLCGCKIIKISDLKDNSYKTKEDKSTKINGVKYKDCIII